MTCRSQGLLWGCCAGGLGQSRLALPFWKGWGCRGLRFQVSPPRGAAEAPLYLHLGKTERANGALGRSVGQSGLAIGRTGSLSPEGLESTVEEAWGGQAAGLGRGARASCVRLLTQGLCAGQLRRAWGPGGRAGRACGGTAARVTQALGLVPFWGWGAPLADTPTGRGSGERRLGSVSAQRVVHAPR